jgi:magnesium transporter
MLSAFILFGDGRVSTATDPDTLNSAVNDPKALFWLDMNQPTDEEYALLDDVFGFHPLAIEDTIGYQQRPKIESYNHTGDVHHEGYFYMVIHGPDLETFKENLQTKELDIFVSSRYLVSSHEKPMKSCDAILQRAQADPHIILDPGIDMLLYALLDRLIDFYQPILDWLQEELDDIEDEAVAHPSQAVLARIAVKKRELLNLRRIVGPQRDVIAQITRGEVPFIRETTRIYFRDILDHLNRAVESIELYRDLVLGARDIYMSSVSNNLNQIMKTLTLISVIALPVTVVTSFFGMNFEALPIIHSATGFWWVMAGLAILEAILIYFFARKHWM